MAIPAFDLHDKLVSAINMITNSQRVRKETLYIDYLPALKHTAEQIIKHTK